MLGQSLLRLGPKPNPDTPRWALQSLRRLAPDPELRREASLLLAAQDGIARGAWPVAVGMWPIHLGYLLIGLGLLWRAQRRGMR